MVLCAICRLDDAFLLLELVLDAPPLSHAGGKRQRRNGQHGCPRLYGEKGLILSSANEWPKATHCSPHRYDRQYKNAGGSFALGEAERGPNHNRATNESEWIVFRGNLQPTAKDNCTQQR